MVKLSSLIQAFTMKFFHLLLPLVLLGTLTIGCGPAAEHTAAPCGPGVDLVVTDLEDRYFDFDGQTQERIDLDQDGKDDFEFHPRQAGNRIARILSGLAPTHTVSDRPFLDAGTSIDSNMVFVPDFDLNGMDANLDNDYGTLANKYFGLRMEVNGEYHYGWVRFSTTDSTVGAPLYYSALSLTLHKHGFNRACGGIVTP